MLESSINWISGIFFYSIGLFFDLHMFLLLVCRRICSIAEKDLLGFELDLN